MLFTAYYTYYHGLGNYLFIFAALLYFTKKDKDNFVVLLYPLISQHSNKKNYFNTILQKFIPYIINKSDEIRSMHRRQIVCSDDYNGDRFGKYDEEEITKTTREEMIELRGHWQNHKYIPDDFMDYLVFPSVVAIIPSNVAFIHVRGGDYFEQTKLQHLHQSNYYDRAIVYFPEDTIFYLFTSDYSFTTKLPWVQKYQSRIEIILKTEEESLAMMRDCERGGIACNSTFSFWGMYFNYKMKHVNPIHIMPKYWLEDGDCNSINYKFNENVIMI